MSKGNIIAGIFKILGKDEALRVASKMLNLDGGPGSGNFGHKGRPGKVGGSGPGGGKQYRGGRADIGYYGSRKDWLNGLQGEEQHKAVRQIAKAKERLDVRLRAKKNIESSLRNGLITEAEAKELIDDGGLADLRDDMSIEEYIMKKMNLADRQELVESMKKSRSWDETKDRLIAENLSEEEKKILDSFEGKEIDQMFSNANMRMKAEKAKAALEAKAMGVELGEIEVPDDIQYALGLKKKRELLHPELPKTAEENDKWFENVDPHSSDYNRMIQIANGTFHTSFHSFSGLPDANNVEQLMLMKTVVDVNQGDDADLKIDDLSSYLKIKDRVCGSTFMSEIDKMDPVTGRIGNLDEGSSTALKFLMDDLLEAENKKYGFNNTITQIGDLLEADILSKDVPDRTRVAYLALKSAALGMPVDNGINLRPFANELLGYRDTIKEKAEREKKLGSYGEQRKKNAVVIKGDSFSEKVNSMRKESGDYSSDEVKNIGTEVVKEVRSKLMETSEKVYQLQQEEKRLAEELNAIKRRDDLPLSEKMHMTFDKNQEVLKMQQRIREVQDENVKEAVIGALKRVRKLGPQDKKAMKDHLPGRSSAKSAVQNAYDNFPSEWVEMSVATGPIKTRSANRGHYNDSKGEIWISGSGDYAKRCASHELGHRFEYTIPGIKTAEAEFYISRTKDEKLVSLKSVTGINYSASEKTRVDKFIDPYMGKDYNGRAYELVSMGVELAFHNPTRLLTDQDYANFIFGILAVA